MAAPQLPPRGKWTTRICGCFEDGPNNKGILSCWVTCVCLCLTFARNAEMVDYGRTPAYTLGRNYLVLLSFVPVLGATLYGCTYRTKLRHHFDLPEQPCGPSGDCCVHHLCCFCALCQEHRELKNRHMNPVGGWRAAYARIMNPTENRAAPIPESGMARN
ncbi:protein PLANT CADMIUM RESISTANCE 7-like [Castanea sativa]|uniref:protein PLANT CADMIUM RESISTANCE 7-like n=1 Tax=Castanea sativa TaxID=21020 RepID=UPI003F654807